MTERLPKHVVDLLREVVKEQDEFIKDEQTKTTVVHATGFAGDWPFSWTDEMSEEHDGYREPITARFDLIPAIFLRALAEIYAEGVVKYGTNAYKQKPLPFSNIVNHLENHLNLWKCGDTSEQHLAKIAWAVATLMVYEHMNLSNDMDGLGGKIE